MHCAEFDRNDMHPSSAASCALDPSSGGRPSLSLHPPDCPVGFHTCTAATHSSLLCHHFLPGDVQTFHPSTLQLYFPPKGRHSSTLNKHLPPVLSCLCLSVGLCNLHYLPRPDELFMGSSTSTALIILSHNYFVFSTFTG